MHYLYHTLNRTLRIAVAPWAPYVNPCAVTTKLPRDRHLCPNPGIDFEIMVALMNYLRLDYQLVNFEDPDWGTLQPNGNYSGVLGDVVTGVLDTITPHYLITGQRQSHGVHFSRTIPYTTIRHGFIYHEPSMTLTVEASQLLYKVFTPAVWLFILACSLSLVVLLFLSLNLAQWKRGREIKSCKYCDFTTIWQAITLALDQYSESPSTGSITGNYGMILLGLLVLFVTTLYQGILVGILVDHVDALPFSSQTELNRRLARGEYSLIRQSGSSEAFFWDEIGLSNYPAYRDLRELIETKPPYTAPSRAEVLERLESNPRLVYPGQQMLNGGLSSIRGRCKLKFTIDSEFVADMTGFPFGPGNKELNDIVSQALADLTGLIHNIELRYTRIEEYKNLLACPPNIVKVGDPLKMKHFYGVFTVYIVCIILSVAIFMAEIIYQIYRILTKKKPATSLFTVCGLKNDRFVVNPPCPSITDREQRNKRRHYTVSRVTRSQQTEASFSDNQCSRYSDNPGSRVEGGNPGIYNP